MSDGKTSNLAVIHCCGYLVDETCSCNDDDKSLVIFITLIWHNKMPVVTGQQRALERQPTTLHMKKNHRGNQKIKLFLKKTFKIHFFSLALYS